MIRPIDIRLNAAHPELPLCEAVTYTGSPSTVLIRGVPPNCGRWAITAVFVAASFPDGSTTTRAAVQSANGVWVATLPATATSGRTANGIRVIADGVDENGEAVTGYILGVADFAIASLAVTPAPEPGETSYQMLYFDEVPSVLRKGDVTKIDGVLKFYNGSAWEPFADAADVPTPSSTAPVMDGTATPGVSNDYARGDHVHPSDTSRVPTSCTVNGKALSSDVTIGDTDIPYTGYGSQYYPTVGEALDTCSQVVASLPSPSDTLYTDGSGNVAKNNQAVDGLMINSRSVALAASNFTPGNLAALDEFGNPTDSGKSAADFATAASLTAHTGDTTIHVTAADKTAWNAKQSALSQAQIDAVNSGITAAKVSAYDGYAATIAGKASAADLRYALTTKSIGNGAVTLDDRAINAVAVSSSLASLTVNFPAATSGKARDFGLRLTVASGITTAPQLVLPQGVVCENADGTAPEIGADGAATILYFTETAAGVFLVKGETVQTIS
jgi:hypothetical protein